MTPYFLKGGTIATVVTARSTESDGAAVKDLPDNGGDFANAVILVVVADVEDFVVHGLTRRLQCEDDRLADVFDMDQRPPRRSVARHPDLFSGPGEPGEVVEDYVEPHARAGAKGRRITQKNGREMGVCECPNIPFDEHFASCIRGLWVGRRLFSALTAVVGGTIHAARGGIYKTRDARLFARPRQCNGAAVVDLIGRALVQLAKGIVRQLCEVDDRVEPVDILGGYPTHVHGEGQRVWEGVVVEPAVAIKAAIYRDNLKAALDQPRSENGTSIAIGAGHQYPDP